MRRHRRTATIDPWLDGETVRMEAWEARQAFTCTTNSLTDAVAEFQRRIGAPTTEANNVARQIMHILWEQLEEQP